MKTKKVRVIPLDATWIQLYLERPTGIDPAAFVFQGNGKPFAMTWESKKWREAADKAAYPNITFYQGTGHSNTRMSEKYPHLNTSGLKKVQRLAPVSPIAAKRSFRAEGK